MCVTGIREGQNIDYGKLKNHHIPLPPREEQDQIVRFLNWKASQINKLINAKKKQIGLLSELKRITVNDMMTDGDDWQRIRLKNITTKIIDCPHETPVYDADGEFLVIRTADQEFCLLRDNTKMYRLKEDEYRHRIRRSSLQKNDIVYGREGERWGFACIVPKTNFYCLGQRMMQFRCDTKKVIPQFVMYALSADYVRNQGVVDTFGSTSPHVNISTIRNYSLMIPKIAEQEAIVALLDKKCKRIDEIIDRLTKETALIAEYRVRLISDVVTGRMDVRSVVVPINDTTNEADAKFVCSGEDGKNAFD